jgi:flagellar hook-length control protein FliK
MSQRELDRKALERSLEAMNRNFFKSQAPSSPVKLQTAPPDRSIDAQSAEPQASEDDGQILKDSIAAFMASRKDESAPATSTPESAPNMSEPQSMSTQHAIDPKEASKINKLVEKLQAAEKGKSKDADDAQIDQLIQKFVAPQAAMKNHSNQAPIVQNAQAQQAQVMPDAAANVKTPPTAALNIPANVLKGILNGDHGQNDDATGGDSDANADASHIGSILNSDTRTQGLSAKSGDFQSQMTQNHQGPQPMTVPDLVKQAQIMVRAGGGEMKVTMHPEGLGEVAMRVTVEKGKVGVQMITESDEAKKLIERQLGDLKASLSNSHLHLDTVKVDTATNLGKQLEQQYHDAQRQQAHMQWEQFRQNQPGGGWKQSFFDINSIRQAYQSDSQAPRDAKAPAATRARSLGSRRLDLVA